jgi:hypothetical protein
MTPQVPTESPQATPDSRPETPELEMDDNLNSTLDRFAKLWNELILTASGHFTSDLDNWIDSVKSLKDLKIESSCGNSCGPET